MRMALFTSRCRDRRVSQEATIIDTRLRMTTSGAPVLNGHIRRWDENHDGRKNNSFVPPPIKVRKPIRRCVREKMTSGTNPE
jgi:hypothetical protein